MSFFFQSVSQAYLGKENPSSPTGVEPITFRVQVRYSTTLLRETTGLPTGITLEESNIYDIKQWAACLNLFYNLH